MAKEVSTNKISYFRVDKDGYIYLTSKTQLEGYKPYYDEKTNNLLGYKKIYSATDEGLIQNISVRTVEFDNVKFKQINIAIEGPNGVECVQFPLLTPSNRLSDYAKALAVILPNVDFNQKYSISFSKKKNDKGFLDKGIYLNYGDREFVRAFHKYPNKELNNGYDIPPLEFVEDITGEKKLDSTKQDKFLMESLQKQIERFNNHKNANYKPAEPVKQEVEESPVVEEEDDEDLPF